MLKFLSSKSSTMPSVLHLRDAPNIQVKVRANKRARRLTLRVSAKTGEIFLTHPFGYPQQKMQQFVDEKSDWIIKHQKKTRQLAFGESLEILGKSYLLARNTTNRTRVAGAILYLPVKKDTDAPKIESFLKSKALDFVTDRVDFYASQIQRAPGEIRLRDTKSRWGSCSSHGDLMLSWRLALAPRDVFDYVIAHEVAHLKYMDHSENFWATVESIFPDYKIHRQWLKTHGQELLRISI